MLSLQGEKLFFKMRRTMKTIELKLDERTLQRVQRLATSRRCTVETLLKEVIEQLGKTERIQESQDWKRLMIEQFLKGYANSDAVYDELPTG